MGGKTKTEGGLCSSVFLNLFLLRYYRVYSNFAVVNSTVASLEQYLVILKI